MTTKIGMNIGRLSEALAEVLDAGGAYGKNLHPSKDVLLRAGEDIVVPLNAVVFEPEGALRLDGSGLLKRPVLSAGYLREAIVRGAQEAEVLLNVGGLVLPLSQVSVSFYAGSLVVFLTGRLEDA